MARMITSEELIALNYFKKARMLYKNLKKAA